MNEQIVNNLVIDIANLHVQNAQLYAQLADIQKEN